MPDYTLPMFPTGPLADLPPPPLLRSYQARAIKQLRALVMSGKKRILVVGPCGMGKTVILSAIVRSASGPVLFVAHRMELLDQCAEQLARMRITNIGIIRANDERTNPSAAVQIASVQTLARRDKPKADIIIVDEAHRGCSDSYVDHVFDSYPNAIILGFTATATRLDGKPLGALFEELLVAATYADLLKRPDWLVAPDCYSAPLKADLSKVRTLGGDYHEGELGLAMSKRELVGQLVDHWLRLAHMHPVFRPDGVRLTNKWTEGERRRTFIFATSIEHSRDHICPSFAAAGVKIAHLDGKTPENERRAMLRDLASGQIEAISNCNILLEGIDVPEAKCVLHARPTQSLVLWRQSTSRILRPWRNVVPLLLDHAGNFDRHGAPHEDIQWSLKSAVTRQTIAKTRVCPNCFAHIPVDKYACPNCGAALPREERPRETAIPTESRDELQLRSSEPDALKLDYFTRHATMARMHGYKPGFAAAKFKEKYGRWPPWEWSEKLKAECAQDDLWQSLIAQREQKRKQREAAQAEADDAMLRDEPAPSPIAWPKAAHGPPPPPDSAPLPEEAPPEAYDDIGTDFSN